MWLARLGLAWASERLAWALERPQDKLKSKLEMVESLRELEIAVSIQREGGGGGEICKADLHYAKLNARVSSVEREGELFRLIESYLQKTHAKTHSKYKLELVDLFEVEREGEGERASKLAHVGNRMLLWHGSRLTNWVGILSQVPPPIPPRPDRSPARSSPRGPAYAQGCSTNHSGAAREAPGERGGAIAHRRSTDRSVQQRSAMHRPFRAQAGSCNGSCTA